MIQRWLHTLSTYQFEIEHRAGKKHSNADSLSRAEHIPENNQPATLTDEQEEIIFEINQIPKWNAEHLKTEQMEDEDLKLIRSFKRKQKTRRKRIKRNVTSD